MPKSKRFLKVFFALLLALLLGVAGLTYAVDPLFRYHRPWFGLQPVLTDERYQNAGIARNFDFDAAILGNSMSENFRPSWFEKAWGTTVKLTAFGSNTVDDVYLLNILSAREKHPSVILHNLDPMLFKADPDVPKHPLPEYLYNDSPFDDVSYLLNGTIFTEHTLKTLWRNLTHTVPDPDAAYCWDDGTVSGREKVLAEYKQTGADSKPSGTLQDSIDRTLANIANLEPYFDSMSDTRFVFFFSPFSMITWGDAVRQGQLDRVRTVCETAFRRLLSHENVTIFFWADDEILTIQGDLDNYRNATHYNAGVSRLIADRVLAGEGILTEANMEEILDAFFSRAADFPYETLFE